MKEIIYTPHTTKTVLTDFDIEDTLNNPVSSPVLARNEFFSTGIQPYKNIYSDSTSPEVIDVTERAEDTPVETRSIQRVSPLRPQGGVKTNVSTALQGVLDIFDRYGIGYNVTSGFRSGATTAQGRQSFHATGSAMDITPRGITYEDWKERIRNTPEIQEYFRQNKLGILDETTPEMLKRTGGTGAHWHIGPDKIAQETFKQWYGKKGGKISILKMQEGSPKEWLNNWYKKRNIIERQYRLQSLINLSNRSANTTKEINPPQTENLEEEMGVGYYYPLTNKFWAKTYSDEIHERTHARDRISSPVGGNLGKISNVLKNENTTILQKNFHHDSYWDSPREINARLNEFRYENNLNPNKIINQNDLDKIKQNNQYHPLHRYNDKIILKLLNEVAYNKPINNKLQLFAKKGGKISRFAKGNKIVYEQHNPINEKITDSVTVPLTPPILQSQTQILGYVPQYGNTDIKNNIDKPELQQRHYNYINNKDEEIKQDIKRRIKNKKQNWTDKEVNLFVDTFKDHDFPLESIVELIDSESGFDRKTRNSTGSSASGLFQFIQGTAKGLLGEEAAKQYKEGTRSFENQMKDGLLQLNNLNKKITTERDKMNYGRLKINMLAPSYGLDDIIPNNIYEGSLSTRMMRLLNKGSSTFRDLMDLYNSGIKN